jgi:hypothetical protein
MKEIGSRREVWNKKAKRTVGGLERKHFFIKEGKVKSIKASNSSRIRIKKRLMERKGKPLSKKSANNSLSLKNDSKVKNEPRLKNKPFSKKKSLSLENALKLKEKLKKECIQLSNKAVLLTEMNERKTKESRKYLRLSNIKIDKMKKISIYIKNLKKQI